MKLVKNTGYLQWPWYFSTIYCILLVACITEGSALYCEDNHLYGRISSHYSDQKIQKLIEIFCTIDWPIIIAARVLNISISPTFQDSNERLFNWPDVSRVNETTIRLCLGKEYQLDNWYYTCSIVAKIKLSSEGGRRELKRLEDFDSQFTRECMIELAQRDSLYLLSDRIEPTSVCLVGLHRIKSNGHLNILNDSVHAAISAENGFELTETCVETINLGRSYRPSSSGCKCNSWNYNQYDTPNELMGKKIATEISASYSKQRTSSGVLLRYENKGYLLQFPNWTCELEYRSEYDCYWHPLSCPAEKLTGISILANVTDLEPGVNYTIRYRANAMQTPHWSPYIRDTYQIQTPPSLKPSYFPETGIGLFQIFRSHPDNCTRTVTIYWGPPLSSHCRNISYKTEAFEVDPKGKPRSSQKVFRLRREQTNWQARYSLGTYAYRIYISPRSSEEKAGRPYIDVPSVRDEVNSDIHLYSINYENNTVEYIWQLPKGPSIANLTFFWYWNEENPTDKFPKLMNWTYLPPNTTKHRMDFDFNIRDKSFRSFISINTKDSSSGLVSPMHAVFRNSRNVMSMELPPLNQELVSKTSDIIDSWVFIFYQVQISDDIAILHNMISS